MRTKKSVLNFLSDIIPFLFLGIIGFFKIKLVISIYGVDTNGFLQLVTQIFAYLMLAEAGFSTAVVYNLYKPFADSDYKKINSIFKGSVMLFRKIGILIFSFGLIAAVVTPFIINKGSLNGSFITIVFILYAIQYLSDYFFGLPYHTLLQADQNKYMANIFRNTFRVLFRTIELLLLYNGVSIILIVITDILFTIFANVLIIRKVKKEYTWLDTSSVEPDKSSYKMTKDVFVHKVNHLILAKTDVIVLAIFGNLLLVTIYSAYDYILKFLIDSVLKLFHSVSSGFGNLLVKDKNDNKPFNEMLSFSFLLAIVISATYQYGINLFIQSWLGETYVLGFISSLLFTLILFNRIVIKPIDVVRDSLGLFKESKYIAILQSSINIILSLILVNKYGINGLLIASLIAFSIISIPLSLNLVYKHVNLGSINKYYYMYITSIFTLLVTSFLTANITIISYSGIIFTILNIILFFIIFSIIMITAWYIVDNNFKSLIKRFKRNVIGR